MCDMGVCMSPVQEFMKQRAMPVGRIVLGELMYNSDTMRGTWQWMLLVDGRGSARAPEQVRCGPMQANVYDC